jgi:hypothetical protein
MRPSRPIRPGFPPFACCEICGENRPEALRRLRVNGRILCLNCSSRKKPGTKPCNLCGRQNVPLQDHHPWGEKLQIAAAQTLGVDNLTLELCENCHAWISFYLLPLMDQQETTDRHPLIILLKFFNVLFMYRLFAWKPEAALYVRQIILRQNSNAQA